MSIFSVTVWSNPANECWSSQSDASGELNKLTDISWPQRNSCEIRVFLDGKSQTFFSRASLSWLHVRILVSVFSDNHSEACQTEANGFQILFSFKDHFKKLTQQSNSVKQSYSPSLWDLLRNMVLARGWSDGLYSIFNSVKTQSVCVTSWNGKKLLMSWMSFQWNYSNGNCFYIERAISTVFTYKLTTLVCRGVIGLLITSDSIMSKPKL